MFAGKLSSKETTILKWQMSDAAWTHWAKGRGQKSIRDVILEGIDQLRENPEPVRERCKDITQGIAPESEHDRSPKHKIRIELPASDLAKACQRADSDGTAQLLGALILESESWRADSKFNSGWYQEDLVSSLNSYTAKTAGFSLGREEKILARIVVGAAIVGAVAAVASAFAAWLKPCSW